METDCYIFGVILGNEVKRVIIANFSASFIRRSSNPLVNSFRMNLLILGCVFSRCSTRFAWVVSALWVPYVSDLLTILTPLLNRIIQKKVLVMKNASASLAPSHFAYKCNPFVPPNHMLKVSRKLQNFLNESKFLTPGLGKSLFFQF